MRRDCLLLVVLAIVSVSPSAKAQSWTGILEPTFGTGACTLSPTDAAAGCAIDWSQTGVAIPSASWTQSGSTIQASTYGNGTTDATSGIQTALNSCSGDKYVLLSTGTFLIDTSVTISGGCELRGSGADQTILNVKGSSTAPVVLGGGAYPSYSGAITISSGASAGSTSLTLASITGVSVGGYLVVSETNNSSWVTIAGGEGNCTWCDNWSTNGTRARSQIVEVESISGDTVTISPRLYTAYTNSPTVVPYTATKYAGVKDLQIYANNTGYTSGIYLSDCAYCWVEGVEDNYSDGWFLNDSAGYRDQIQSNYFSNDYVHQAGTVDSAVFIDNKTSASQVVNNIVERGHASILLEWGAAGNVVAYNYMEGQFDSGINTYVGEGIGMHGAHPQFNLIEGNVSPSYNPDEVWGSSSHNTNFRNWWLGTTPNCTPLTGRGTVNCTGSNLTWEYQASRAESVDHLSWYDNFVGDVAGSSDQDNLLFGGNPTSHVGILNWTNSCSQCRSYDSTNYNFTFGFGESGDDGSSNNGCDGSTAPPCHSVDAYETSLIYNSYTYANTRTNCLSGGSPGTCPISLPTSFYLSSKPSWWSGNVAWPAIGPDVTGESGPGGHASLTASNPAQYCYLVIMGGSEGGAGSPLTFNEDTCYGVAPAAPTHIAASVQ
jgi:hypothetical protein